MSKTSTSILSTTYKHISSKFNMIAYKKLVSAFLEARNEQLYDTCPCDRIFFSNTDYQQYWVMNGFDEQLVHTSIQESYYGEIKNFNPIAAKDPLTVAQLSIIRMFLEKNNDKEAELAAIYLSFSGKFYPSIHYGSYPKAPPSQYRHVMEYVVNNKLSNNYDIKTTGSVFGAISELVKTWIKSYRSKFKSFKDDDCVYLIQQLHSRIKSFTINIARLYYEAYENKDEYMSYTQDTLVQGDDNNSVIVDENDTIRIEYIVQKAMERINTKGVDYKICLQSADYNVRANEIKGLIENIITNPDQQPIIKEFIGLLVAIYFSKVDDKDINNIKFITISVRSKSNIAEPNAVRAKEIVEIWLQESPAYRKRSKRLETKASYHRAITAYFALTTYQANK